MKWENQSPTNHNKHVADMTTKTPLQQAAEKIAGHIRKPMTADEIAETLKNGEYSAELVLQHLLLLVTNATVDLPDTAAQDSASKSNSPAVSG